MASQPCANTKHIKMLITCSMSDPKSQRAGEWTTATQAAQHKRKSSAIKLVPREFRSKHQRSFTHNVRTKSQSLFLHCQLVSIQKRLSNHTGRKGHIFHTTTYNISIFPLAAGRSEVAAAAKVKLCSICHAM